MPRLGVVGRLMASIALLALGLGIVRAWWDSPHGIGAGPIGELGPAGVIVLASFAAAVSSSGRFRRSFDGLATMITLLALGCWFARPNDRDRIYERILVPLDQMLSPPLPSGQTPMIRAEMMAGLISSGDPARPYECRPFHTREARIGLTVLELAAALPIALLAANLRAPGRRRPPPSTPPDQP